MWKSVVAPAAVVSALWIAVSLFTTHGISVLIESNSRTISEDVTTIEAAWAMRRDSWRLQTALLDAVQSSSGVGDAGIRDLENHFRSSLEIARRTSLTAPEQALVGTITGRFTNYVRCIQEILDARQAGPVVLSSSDRQKLSDLATGLTDACRELSDVNERLISERAAQSKSVYSFVLILRQCCLIIGPGLGLLVGVILSRRMSRSLSHISATLQRADRALAKDHVSPASPCQALPALHRQADRVADRVGQAVIELEKRQQRITQAERLAAVGELAAGVAHEIRNPLTSVKLLVQNAARQPPGRAMSKQQSELILQEILRMESLVQDLLDFARPPRLRITHHDIIPTLRRAINLVAARAQQRNVTIQEEFKASTISLQGDIEQLLLVFVNLAINGIEAMNTGTLRITAENSEGFCRITFLDEGPGIPPSVLARLFNPFVTTKERGTGLGLAISRRIVQEHGGSLMAENRSSGGAALRVELPLAFAPLPGSILETQLNGQSRNPVDSAPEQAPLPMVTL